MATWTTHTEGGRWSGGGTDVPDCSLAQREAIINAFNNFSSRSCLDCFGGLSGQLNEKWREIEIDCTDSECDTLDGRNSGNNILICNTSSSRVGPVLLHEMVHACGGTEMDSEAVEHACFNGSGATAPFGDDWDKFRSETDELEGNEIERVGKFMIWNSDTGEVWEKVVEGGSWASGGTVRKGRRCFQSNSWIHSYSGGGSWI
ncbi:MAG: hypothetical protein ABW007_17035 [Chitinophagaceae bacterium]